MKCEDCKYLGSSDEGLDICRRNTPSMKPIENIIEQHDRREFTNKLRWPPVNKKYDWCGEFELKRIKPKPSEVIPIK